MRQEIKSAADFLTNLLRLGNSLDFNQLDMFRTHLEIMLKLHYQQHWFPENPFKGSGYRCLRINHKMDPVIAKAGKACGLDEAHLREVFPNELSLWIDPLEVSYRIGENGSICVLFEGSKHQICSEYFDCRVNITDMSSYSNGSVSYPTNNQFLASLSKFPRSSCKDNIRGSMGWDGFHLEPRNMGLEQLAAYVSS